MRRLDHAGTQGGDGHLQAEERGLGRTWPALPWTSGSGPQTGRQ